MPWIESHSELGNHHKTRRLARLLGISVAQAIGHLHLLWWWATGVAEDGDLSCHDPEDIATAMMWTGEPATLIDGLCQAGGPGRHGFLERTPSLRIHDWDVYTAHLRLGRERNREKQRRYRERMSGQARNRNTAVTDTSGQYVLPESDRMALPVVTSLQDSNSNSNSNSTRQDSTPLPPAGDTTRKKAAPVYPEWFEPITRLPGFLNANHARAIDAIIAACDVQDINPGALMVEFAAYWPRGRLPTSQGGHGWTNPVRALIKTLDIQISKHLRGGNSNGHDNDARPIREQDHGAPANAPETASPFAKYR